MSWLRLDTPTPRHVKVLRLSAKLGVPPAQGLGHYVTLLCWTMDQRPGGNIGDLQPAELAAAAGWNGDPAAFYEVFMDPELGLVDHSRGGANGRRTVLHGWEERQGHYLRERARKSRDGAKKARDDDESRRADSALRTDGRTNEETAHLEASGKREVSTPYGRTEREASGDGIDRSRAAKREADSRKRRAIDRFPDLERQFAHCRTVGIQEETGAAVFEVFAPSDPESIEYVIHCAAGEFKQQFAVLPGRDGARGSRVPGGELNRLGTAQVSSELGA